jgi:lipopolysaccharide transport system ATP-binding protein
MAAVENLCKRALLLDGGEVKFVGAAKHCVASYLDFGSFSSGGDVDLSSHSARGAGSRCLLKRVRLLDSKGNVRDRFVCGDPMKIEFTFDPVISLRTPQFGIGVNDWMGTRIFSITTYFSDSQLPSLNDLCRVTCEIDDIPLAPGRYSLSLSAGTLENTLIDNLENAVSFDVESADFYGNGRIPEANFGRVLVRSRWEKTG